jgi:hypothetical protein
VRWLALALLLGCSTSRSAEREDSFAQQGETRREEGPVRVTTTVDEYADPDLAPAANPVQGADLAPFGTVDATKPASSRPPLLRHTVTVTERAPVVSTTQTQTTAAGEAKEARSARFGWSPWTIAVGLAVAAILAYAAYRLKSKLPF